jgi:hypothetical protein
MKQCAECGTVKPLTEYGKYSRGADGLRNTCKPCTRAGNNRRHAERVAVINKIKLDAGCADCGYNEHACALDFDHLPEHEKLFNIGCTKDKGLDTVLAEIAKCEVVCANCHRVRTQERRNEPNE